MDRARLVAALAALVVLAGGCDGDDGSDETASGADVLDTEAAVDGVRRIAEEAMVGEANTVPLDECPVADLGDVAEQVDSEESFAVALPGEPRTTVVCVLTGAAGELWLQASADPADAEHVVIGDDARPSGESHGGTFAEACEPTDGECAVQWSDDHLLVAVGGSLDVFPAAPLQEALTAALPSVVERLADA